MTRSKTKTRSRRPHQRLAKLQLEASEVAARRLLSLPGKSLGESNQLWSMWGWEKMLAAQRVGWEASWALWSSAFAPWTMKTGERLVRASVRPLEQTVRSNRTRLRAGR